MINPISNVNYNYIPNIKNPNQAQTNTVAAETPVFYADPSQAIKSELSVNSPISYTAIRDLNIPYSNPAKLYKLANGQKVIILPKQGPTVVKSYFNVGSMNEKEAEKGIFHFIEHMKFNGSKNLEAGEFFNTVNKMGASTNASTGMSTTDYYVESQMLGENDLEKTIKIHADMLQYPNHTPEMVEKEKGPVTSEISMVSDEPVNLAMNSCLKNLFQIKTNSPDLIAGTIGTINNLSSDTVKTYDETWYSPDNCTTVITGNVDPQKTIELVSKYFNSQKTANVQNRVYTEFTPIEKPVRNDIIMPKAQSTTVLLGFSGPKNKSDKELILQSLLMSTLFGNKNNRISGALDKIHSSGMFSGERIGNRPDDPNAIMFISQTSPEKAEDVLRAYYSAIQELKTNPITDNELASKKLRHKMIFSKITESSSAINSLIGSSMMNNSPEFAEKYVEILDSITAKDANDFVNKYLDLNKVSISMVHPENIDNETLMTNYKKSSKVSFKGNVYPKVFDEEKIKQFTLFNNINTLFNPNTSNLVDYKLSLDTRIPANVKHGTQELLSFILDEGSLFKTNAQFQAITEAQGINLSFFANSREIEIGCTAPENTALNSLALAKETLLNPRFTQETLDYAKNRLMEIVNNEEKSSTEKLSKELFPNIAEFATSEDIKAAINNITLEDVIGLYQYIMKNAQADFVMTAPIEKNPALIQQTINSLSTNLPKFQPKKFDIFQGYTPIKENKVIKQEDKRIQAEIEQAFTFKVNANPKDRLIFNLLDSILGGHSSSRLFSDLREQQKLAYRVNSDFTFYGDTGVASLYIKTTTDDPQNNLIQYDNVQKSLDGFKKHIEKLRTEKVSQEELDAAKLRLKTSLLNGTETSSDQTHTLMTDMTSPYSFKSTNLYLKLIDEITADDILNAANYVFSGNSVTSIVASPNTLKNISA